METMAKRNTLKIGRDSSTGKFVGGYRVLGTTRDGVAILKSSGRATHFTDKELSDAVRAAISSRASASRDRYLPKKG